MRNDPLAQIQNGMYEWPSWEDMERDGAVYDQIDPHNGKRYRMVGKSKEFEPEISTLQGNITMSRYKELKAKGVKL